MKPIEVKLDSSSKSRAKKLKKYEASLLKNKKTISKEPSPWKSRGKKFVKILSIILLILTLVALVASPFVYKYLYIPGLELKDSVIRLADNAQVLKDDFDNQDLVAMSTNLENLKTALADTKELYGHFGFAGKIPVVKGYYANGVYTLTAAELSFPVIEDLIAAATPIADVFGYKTSTGIHEEVGGQEKIETIIRNLPDISGILSESRPQIDLIIDELNKVDPKYIPEEIKGYRLRDKFDEVSEILTDGKETMSDLEELLNVLPDMAGAPVEKTYLILFQNDKEIRPTGGFLTAYGYATIENGQLGDIESEDIYNLDSQLYSYEPAPAEIQEYLGQYEWHIRDVNIYPDLISTSLKFEEQYENQYNPRPFDGIIYLDTQFVEALMEVTGPIEMIQYGDTVTSDNVVMQLEIYSEKILTGGSDRKQFMEDLMGELMDRLLNANRDQWGGLINAVFTSLDGKHLMLYFHDSQVQNLVSKFGFTGEIDMDWEGDYLHINESNMGGLKSNMYVTSNVRQEIEIGKSGDIIKTVKIHWENPEPKDHWLNGPYRSWLRVYVPYGSKLLSGDVGERTVNESWNEPDYGKTIFETLVTVPTAETEDSSPGVFDLEFSYKIPNNLIVDDLYRLKIQKQPGKSVEDYVIRINGREEYLTLEKDTELEFKL